MRNRNLKFILMAFMAMSFFKPSNTFSQEAAPSAPKLKAKAVQKIKTPETKDVLLEDKSATHVDLDKTEAPAPEESSKKSSGSAAPRRLQQHGLGLGIGETFLLGKYSKYGEDKITMDVLYTYAASYSFDLLVNAHWAEHEDKQERMRVMGLTSSIKARVVEYDNFSPFVLGGLGFYAPRAKRAVGNENKWSEQKITFGLNFGGGMDLRLNEHYLIGLMGQMHWPFSIKQDEGPDVQGYYFKLLLTGMYLF